MLHAMRAIESSSHFKADALVTIYGNVPIRGEGVIDAALGETRRNRLRLGPQLLPRRQVAPRRG